MSYKVRYDISVKVGEVVSFNRQLGLVVSRQYDLFGSDLIGVYFFRDFKYREVSASKVLPTKFSCIFSRDSDGVIQYCVLVKPGVSRVLYMRGLKFFDGLRDEVFEVRKVDTVRRMVYLMPLSRFRIGAWVTFYEFIFCFKLQERNKT